MSLPSKTQFNITHNFHQATEPETVIIQTDDPRQSGLTRSPARIIGLIPIDQPNTAKGC